MHIREQVAIRRGEYAHVDGPRPVLTDAPDLAFLQDPEQFDLHGRRDIADFVEEQRAAVRGLEEAGTILRRTRE